MENIEVIRRYTEEKADRLLFYNIEDLHTESNLSEMDVGFMEKTFDSFVDEKSIEYYVYKGRETNGELLLKTTKETELINYLKTLHSLTA